MGKDELEAIRARNAKVEADKAWETSNMRRGVLAVATYFVVVVFLVMINAPNPFVNGLIPAAAYLLQTFSLPFLKNWWINNRYRK